MASLIPVFVGFSVLLIVLSVPMIRGWVKPNAWYGFRIPLTLNHPDIWYPANCYAARLLLTYALVLLVVVVGLPCLLGGLPEERPTEIYALSIAFALLVGIVPIVVLSLRYARTLARKHESNRTR